LRDVHRQIRGQGRRKDYASNIKLGPGGIREIEFIAQALQLVRGGREPALRPRGTLPALAALAARGLLPSAAVAELGDAYVFLRDVEHRLQYRDDAQTHELPADAESLIVRTKAFPRAICILARLITTYQIFRTQWPLFPPLFSSSRTGPIEIAFSTALHMS